MLLPLRCRLPDGPRAEVALGENALTCQVGDLDDLETEADPQVTAVSFCGAVCSGIRA